MNESHVFADVLKLATPAERAAYLDEVCAGDPKLRADVEALLRAHANDPGFLEQPAGSLAGTADIAPPENRARSVSEEPGPEQPGMVLAGRYKLLELIGEGGMGAVWMAQQTEPVKRLVAVKLIKAGLGSKAVLTRFEAERQALALMDHPNIARVLDAGTIEPISDFRLQIADCKSEISNLPSAIGRPFFVMELVKGVTITRYCDEHRLTPRQRLELFVPVCQAVQHAHHKGIIHRDLKPSNVLVALYDDRPVPKVIDFGVAKATGQQLTEQTLHTGFGAVVGTVEYMSPEQASFNQLDVDTRSDIYSLGVLLYELLTGSPPFTRKELEQAGMLEMLRLIREKEPSKPSTKLSTAEGLPTLAANRGTEPKRLTAVVRGELDWIVMKALEKDRSRRYETANGFAMDLQRYLQDEPVQACPPSALYRFRKFVRRNKVALVSAVLIAASLVVAVVALAVSNVLISDERDAKEEALGDKVKALATAKTNFKEAQKQKKLADANASKALEKEKTAQEQELLARRRFYAAQINLAHGAWEMGKPARVLELLETLRPKADEPDLRTFEWYYLRRLCHKGRQFELRGHRASVTSLTFSRDGKMLASAGWDGIVIWNAASGRGHIRLAVGASALAFSPDGAVLACACPDGMLRLWDAGTWQPRLTLPAHQSYAWAVVFSPDGKTLASASQDTTVKLWDPATGKLQATLRGHEHPVGSIAISPDGKTLASSSWSPVVKVWDLAARRERLTVGGGGPVFFAPDGSLLCGGGAKRWDATTGKPLPAFGPIGNRAVAVSRDGKTMAFGAYSREVQLWDAATAKTRTHHGRLKPIGALAFSPDGKTLASGADDGTIELWDVVPRQETDVLGHGPLVQFSSQGNTLLTANRSGIREWDVRTCAELGKKVLVAADNYPQTVALSPDGATLALPRGASIGLIDRVTGREIGVLEGHGDSVMSCAFSPDGRRLAAGTAVDSAGGSGTLKLWDVHSRQAGATTTGLSSVRAVAFSPDGKTLAAGGQNGLLWLWDLGSGTKTTLQGADMGPYRWISALAFSRDGKTLAAGGDYGALQVWNLDTRQVHAFLKGHYQFISSMAFSPDGTTLASASDTVKLWDVQTGQERFTLRGHEGFIHSVAFSPDGKTLATGDDHGSVRLWRATADGQGQYWIARGRLFAEHGEHQMADAAFAKAASLTPAELNRFIDAGWWVVGPYPGDRKASCPPEKDPDPSRPVAAVGSSLRLSWRGAPTGAEGYLDLNTLFPDADSLSAYALTYVTSPDERTALLHVGGIRDDVRVWLNGRLIHEAAPAPWPWTCLYRVPMTLRAGRNTLLVRVFRRPGSGFGVLLRIADNPLDRAVSLAELALWDEAARLSVQPFERQPSDNIYLWAQFAALPAAIGDAARYHRYCASLLEKFGARTDEAAGIHVPYACNLIPSAARDHARLLQLAKKAQNNEAWRRYELGLAYYRVGQFEQAIQQLEAQEYLDPRSPVQALAYHRLGHADKAKQCLAKVEEWYHTAARVALARPVFTLPMEWAWYDYSRFLVLRREAKTLIDGAAPKDDPSLAALQAKARQFLKRLDKRTAAYDWMLALQQDQPRLWLARARRYAELKRWQEADADVARAAELRPTDPEVWAERARIYAENGQPDKAAADFSKALDLLADCAMIAAEAARVDEVFTRVVKLRPNEKKLWSARADHFGQAGQWKEAAAAVARWVELAPADHESWFADSALRLYLGDGGGYRRACREMLQRFEQTDDPNVAERTAKTCLLAVDAVGDLKPVLKLAERAVTGTEKHGDYRWFVLARGMADYRAGRFAGSIAWLEKALTPGTRHVYCDAIAQLFLAMAQHRLGRADEARKALHQARALVGQKFPNSQRGEPVDADWDDWLRFQIAHRQAMALIEGSAKSGQTK